MSQPALPKVSLSINDGAITPDAKDIIIASVHLGCGKEVSSFEAMLFNFDKKYNTTPNIIERGDDIVIGIGRTPYVPTQLTGKIEELDYEDDPVTNLLWLRGRCEGRQLFDRVATVLYENQKGEAIVKDLIDNYTSLSHVRNSTELIEDTDTTYEIIEHDDTPIKTIIDYISSTASKSGVIGMETRVEYDGKFAMFPKMTKTAPFSVNELFERSAYRETVERIRNWIRIRGAAEKPNDPTKDFGTDMVTPYKGSTVDQPSPSGQKNLFVADTAPFSVGDKIYIYDYPNHEENEVESIVAGDHLVCVNNLANSWGGNPVIVYPGWGYTTAGTTISADNAIYLVGSRSVKVVGNDGGGWIGAFYKPDGHMNLNEYPSVNFVLEVNEAWSGFVRFTDGSFKQAYYVFPKQEDDSKFHFLSLKTGRKNEDGWEIDSGFDWTNIWTIEISMYDGTMTYWIDGLFLDHKRWEYIAQNLASQAAHGRRDLSDIYEELHSDNACELRAKSLLDWLEEYGQTVELESDVIDYGNNHIHAADKINIEIPNENIDLDFRIDAIEINAIPEQLLNMRLRCGITPPLWLDYVYETRNRADILMRSQVIR